MSSEANGAPFISFDHVQKSYDGETCVVKDLSFEVNRGEFLTMLGPSGSGKTTCLMMLAGFETATSGEIKLDGTVINSIPPYKRGIGMVFQNYALFPHMTVAENLAFPLEVRDIGKSEREEKIKRALDMVELGDLAHRRPAQLSGGQQQRIALARSLVFDPELVLMDEPLGALDKQLREQLQYEIMRLHEKLGITIIYVTHDQTEALTMSHRIAVFNEGVIQQIDEPAVLYERPQNSFVAQFIGEINMFTGKVSEQSNGLVRVKVNGTSLQAQPVNCGEVGSVTKLAVRPEQVHLGDELENKAEGVVRELVYLGEQIRCRMNVFDNDEFIVKWPNASMQRKLRKGEKTTVSWSSENCLALDA